MAEARGEPEWLASHLAVPTVAPRPDGGLDVYVSSRDRDGRSHICRVRPGHDWPRRSAATPPELVLAPGERGHVRRQRRDGGLR